MTTARLKRLIDKHGLKTHAEGLLALAGPAVRLTSRRVKGGVPVGKPKLGGLPHAPRGFRWPMAGKEPLTLVAQIDLDRTGKAIGWPRGGHLLFFYDVENQPWGFDPKDGRSSAIVYLPAGSGRLIPIKPPTSSTRVLPECAVTASPLVTIPPSENAAVTRLLPRLEDQMKYFELYSEFWGDGDEPNHQLFGWPQAVQHDMEVECQLAYHGINCGGEDEEMDSPRAQVLAAAASRWNMLLQVGSDDRLEVMWGDLGKVYFFCTCEAQASGKFDERWTILQCS